MIGGQLSKQSVQQQIATASLDRFAWLATACRSVADRGSVGSKSSVRVHPRWLADDWQIVL